MLMKIQKHQELGLPFALLCFYQAYCILVVHYCHVTSGRLIKVSEKNHHGRF